METKKRYKESLELLKSSGNFRSLPVKSSASLIDLSSNDYLGLLSDEGFKKDFYATIDDKIHLPGSGSSRLLSGNSSIYTDLEQLLAANYQREACLLYNSGYHANMGILPALANKKDLVVADKLVHASLIDGMRLSNATITRFKHLDYEHLEKILLKQRADFENVFIVTESIFSMDGDVADIKKLVELKSRYQCFLYVDEAHAVGARGKKGLGCVEEANLLNEVDFIVGTFGKALASVGAFVVCDDIFKQYLINHSRTLIYTTALPPLNLAWTKYVFERLGNLQAKRERLKEISSQFGKLLKKEIRSHIVPYIIGGNQEAIDASGVLKQNGFNVLPIRYPTVPQNTARLRFSLNAGLDMDEVSKIKDILEEYEGALAK